MNRRFQAIMVAWARFVLRRRLLVLSVSLFLSLASAFPLYQLRIDNSVEAFLADDDPVRVAYDAFRDEFGWDKWIVLAVDPEGELLSPPFLDKLAAFHHALEESVPYVDEIKSLANARYTYGVGDQLIVEDLMEGWSGGSAAELDRLRERIAANPVYRGTLLSWDGRLTTVTIEPQLYAEAEQKDDVLSDFDAAPAAAPADTQFLSPREVHQLLAAVQAVVERFEGSGFRVRMGGGPVIADRLNTGTETDLGRFLSATLLIVVATLFVLFRSVAGVVLPLLVVVLSTLSTLGMMGLLGIPLSLTTEILPPLLLTLGVFYAVHILAIAFQHMRAGEERDEAIVAALGHTGLPVVTTAATTAAGFLSFVGTDFAPISDLGIVAPIGVVFASLLSLSFLPAAAALVLPRRLPFSPDAAAPGRRLEAMGTYFAARPIPVLAVSAAIVALACAGMTRLRFSQDELEWFPPHEPVREAMELFNARFAGAVSVEAVIDGRDPNGAVRPELLSKLAAFHDEVSATAAEADGLRPRKAFSIVDVLRETNRALHGNDGGYYAVPDDASLIAQELLLFESSGNGDLERLANTDYSRIRLSMRVPWVDAMHYRGLLDDLERRLRDDLGPSVELTITGVTALFARVATALIEAMVQSSAIALLAITPMMMLLLQSVRLGLIAMIPNVAPILATLGVMGFFDIPLDLSTVLVASIMLGISVDDTVHFTHTFQREIANGRDPLKAAAETMRTTGGAILATSLVVGAGFAALAMASMKNVAMFGLLAALATTTALIADLTLSPALFALANRRRAP